MLTQLIQLIGDANVTALAHEFGGSRVYIPKSDTPRAQRFRDLIGNDAYNRLCQSAHGCFIWIPTQRKPGPRLSREQCRDRNREIKSLAHLSRRELARRYALTEAQVYTVLKTS
jgi:Mor family transcriptional regulator